MISIYLIDTKDMLPFLEIKGFLFQNFGLVVKRNLPITSTVFIYDKVASIHVGKYVFKTFKMFYS